MQAFTQNRKKKIVSQFFWKATSVAKVHNLVF